MFPLIREKIPRVALNYTEIIKLGFFLWYWYWLIFCYLWASHYRVLLDTSGIWNQTQDSCRRFSEWKILPVFLEIGLLKSQFCRKIHTVLNYLMNKCIPLILPLEAAGIKSWAVGWMAVWLIMYEYHEDNNMMV
jgi:hypothetical protein